MGPPPRPPPWAAVALLARYLDPKALAAASCVCKSWNSIASSDHLWKPHCLSLCPSLSHLPPAAPCKSLFALFHLSSSLRRRRHVLAKPRVAAEDLVFHVDLFLEGSSPALSLAVEVATLASCNGVFRYEALAAAAAVPEGARGLRAVWAVVRKGWEGVFVAVDRREGQWVRRGEVWFREEAAAPPCCGARSGMEAEVGFWGGEGGEGVHVSVGLMSAVDWRYVSVDDALRYLQHFLL